MYSYLKSKGIGHNHAMGILANIEGESGFEIGVGEKGDSKSGVGLFQYSDNDRKPRFLKSVPDYKKNWKSQIDYAINEDRAPEYFKTQFSSPEAAAYWWMDEWERPSARVYSDRNKKHNNFIKSFKSGGSQVQQTPPQRTPTPAQTSTIPSPSPARGISTTVRDEIDVSRNKSPLAGLTPGQGYLARGGGHKGIDIGTYGEKGFYVSLKLSGTVDYIGWDKDGYGNFVDIKSGNAIYRFAHLAKVMVKRGQPYNGETIGEIGTTGRSSSEHLHYEVLINGKDVNPKPYLGLLSIGRQLTGIAGKKTQISTPTPTPKLPLAQVASAQVSSRLPQAQVSSTTAPGQSTLPITQNRRGPQIMFVNPAQPSEPQQVSSGGGGGTTIQSMPTEYSLNSMIKNQILLELAYT